MSQTSRYPHSHVLKLFIKFTPVLTYSTRLPNMLIFSRGLCILVGLGWLFVLPLDEFSRRNYISENALLPGQVEAYFGGSELNIIKAYRAEVESWASSTNPNL
jgi:GPI-anchor transamidase subunit GAA1